MYQYIQKTSKSPIKILALSCVLSCLSYACSSDDSQNQESDTNNQTQSIPKEEIGITFDFLSTSIKLGNMIEMRVYQTTETQRDLNISKTAQIKAQPSDLVEIQQDALWVNLVAKKAGTVTITASLDGQENTQTFEILQPNALVLSTTAENVKSAQSFQLDASFSYENGDAQVIQDATWQSLTPDLASVDEKGFVTILKSGLIKIQAEKDQIKGTFEVQVDCRYPNPTEMEWDNLLKVNTVIPPIYWSKAYSAQQEIMINQGVNLKDIYCGGANGEFKDVKTINLILTAGWCPSCPDYLREVKSLSSTLKSKGGLLIYVEVQDESEAAASTAFAAEFLGRLLGQTEGYFVGDGETQPTSEFFNQSTGFTSFPSAFVIRRSDMKIISSQEQNQETGMLPFLDIAENPNGDWEIIEP
jgi:hypothetical protein